MKTTLRTLLVLGCIGWTSTSVAMAPTRSIPAKAKLAEGAGTLPKGTGAFSLDLGIGTPGPLLYDVRYEFGITDRFQLGVRGTTVAITAGAGLPAAFNLFTSGDGAHLVGLRMSPSYTYLNAFGLVKLHAFTIDPTLAYEYRWGAERRGGFFVKAGSAHIYAKVTDDIFSGFFGTAATSTKTWAHALQGKLGFQQRMGEKFSLVLEGGAVTNLSNKNILPAFKLGLTWAF